MDGADLLDVGARPAGVGTRHVSVEEELDLITSSVSALRERFDVPLSVDTWRAPVAAAAFEAGATLGNDLSGFSDPAYLPTAAAAGAAVVAAHIRLPPQVPDPQPAYDDVVQDVRAGLEELVRRAWAAGIGPGCILVDPGLDLGKTWRESLDLLAATDVFCGLGHPMLLAASNKIFLGRLLRLEIDERTVGTAAACSLGILLGARVIRVHDARVGRQVADLAAAILQRRGEVVQEAHRCQPGHSCLAPE